ncbi:MAG: putative polysaccharide biosynthesis protein [Acidimicrobiales bacterium]|nr:putative polysaccharide biosynthesis protein [Acidimicrobiales bacterium]
METEQVQGGTDGRGQPTEANSARWRAGPSPWMAILLASTGARRRIQAVADGSAMALSIVVAVYLRYDFSLTAEKARPALLFALLGVAVLVLVGLARGLYAGKQSFSSFEEFSTLVGVILCATLVLVGLDIVLDRMVPLSVPLIASTLVLTFSSGVRYVWRWYLEKRLRPNHENVERVVVIGAGEGGQQIITAMLRNPSGRYLPVALLDDDPMKRNLRVRGVPVRGGHDQIDVVAESEQATVALLAIPSAGSALIRDVEERAARAGLRLLVLPASSELYGAEVGVGDIRPVTPADLLGRHEHDTDLGAIAGYITGKRVLVTGAGGSIGSELCRQLYRFAPASLVMLERDESALHAVQLSIEGRAMLDSRNLVVADIRDSDRIQQVFAEHRPEVVFHAAALKHLPLLEMHPSEALKTNVWGTISLLEASIATGVERFVNISTDKAADPISVLGYTKRLAERLTAQAAVGAEGTYLSVRFGNVLGSRGSVLTAFTAQIEMGGPVTVTDRDITRYFMTVEEAVQLTIQAGAVGQPGEALVLDMGEPVRIDDVARRLIAEASRPVEIVYTGMRDGEKLHEILFGSDEVDERPAHPGISHVRVPPLHHSQLPSGPSDGPELTRALAAACGLDEPVADSQSSSHRFA